MSEVKTDKLTGVGTAGSIVVTGEGNSTTTNLQQGLGKVWCNQTNGTTINDSFNTSSVDDNGTGSYETNLTSSMSSNDYARNALGGTGGYRTSIDTISHASNTASSIYTYCARTDTGAAIDVDDVSSLGHGDLA
tara:strand:+ start:839 stop:1240 length:402 start_codon:yes stop_codon:yes gene_type:complete